MRQRTVALSLFLSVACVASAFAQKTTGDITGSVSDTTGGVLPGVTVNAVCTATGLTRTATTDTQGGFSLPELPICVYKVTVELPGFKTVSREVQIAVNAVAKADFKLEVGAQSETITVEGVSPLVEFSDKLNNRVDSQINGFGSPRGTFQASKFVYLGNDLTHVTNWLAGDARSFVGATNNLDDGAIRLSGFINVATPGTVNLGTTSDDGSRITIAGIDVINNDGSHGDVTLDTNVVFAAAGLYPIEITFFNGDWTSDGTGANLNHSGNPDPSVHGGANFHLRVIGTDVTTNSVTMFFPVAPAGPLPAELGQILNGFQLLLMSKRILNCGKSKGERGRNGTCIP